MVGPGCARLSDYIIYSFNDIVHCPSQKDGARSSADWAVDPAELEAAFSPKTKLFILNTPNNPLGKVCCLLTY